MQIKNAADTKIVISAQERRQQTKYKQTAVFPVPRGANKKKKIKGKNI